MAHGRLAPPVAAVLAAVCLVAGCSGTGAGQRATQDDERTPDTIRPYREPEFADTRGVTLAAAAGGPGDPVPIPVWGGDATLGGALSGPDGPVVGGRVRLERFVGQASTSVEITTNREGRWQAHGIHGGRYRVRGWRIPDLAMNQSVLLFLGASEERTLDLDPTLQGGVDVQAALLTPSPTIDQPVTLTALITRHEVDINGIVQATPLAGLGVTVSSSGGWEGVGVDTTVNGEGRADWTLTCTAPSPGPLRVVAGEGSTTVDAPSCLRPPTPVPPPDDPPDPPDEPVANFGVGASFTPPFAGPLPAGTYDVTETSGACALVFERWNGSGWGDDRVTDTSTDQLVLSTFVRNLETLGDTPPCTYRRVA